MSRLDTIAPGVARLVAPNPSPMTADGTNTYLVFSASGEQDGKGGGPRSAAIIDPGPDIAAHVEAIKSAVDSLGGQAGGPLEIEAVLLTHTHLDHTGCAAAVAKHFQAPLCAYGRHGDGMSETMKGFVARGEAPEIVGGEGADRSFTPDRRLADGESVRARDGGWALTAVYTPGHLSDHHAFALATPAERETGLLFSGDVVMGWSTSVVSPPGGDMTSFYATLDRLEARADTVYAPGHGDVIAAPKTRIAELRAHRLKREASVLAALPGADEPPRDLAAITVDAYADTPGVMLRMAERNALAHLIDLGVRGIAEIVISPGEPSRFRRAPGA